MLLLVCMLALWNYGLAQDYHYPRPQIPFHLSPQPKPPVREPSTRFIVQTLGPHGRTYELQMQKAPAIYVAHQTFTVPQQQQLQQHQQHHVQQPLQKLHASAFQNPLLGNTNYQQMPVSLTAPLPHSGPPAPPIGYYGQGQSQGQAQIQSHVQQSVDSYYNEPQALTIATATHAQPAAQYGAPPLQVQEQPQWQPHNSNPQPYAFVTLPSGQRVQDAGHGSGPSPTASGHSNHPTRLGDYNAQSQSATLDTYNYKQSMPGDARSYQRFVTNCQPNGQCQQLTLNPGQIDVDHQQLLQAARSQTQPAEIGCKKSAYVPPGAQQNEQGQLRPRGRRTHAHVQEQLTKYPYN